MHTANELHETSADHLLSAHVDCSFFVPSRAKDAADARDPPWRLELIPGGFRIADCNGTPLACVYAPEEGTHSTIPGVILTRAEAQSLMMPGMTTSFQSW